MAHLIHFVIKNQLNFEFHERVEKWNDFYLGELRRNMNAGRIAANHAALAAALELFAKYMGDAWQGSEQTVREFCEGYLVERVHSAAGEVAADLPATIFLDTLRELIATEQVLLDGLGKWIDPDKRDQDRVVGKKVCDSPPEKRCFQTDFGGSLRAYFDVIGIRLSLALAKVQDLLVRQGKPRLAIKNQTLIQQLTTLGLLVDQNGKPFEARSKGSKSAVLSLGGNSSRMVMFLAGTLAIPDEPGATVTNAKAVEPAKTLAAMTQEVFPFPQRSLSAPVPPVSPNTNGTKGGADLMCF
jgi:hypothetical protein